MKDKLKELRTSYNLSQGELADIMHVSRSCISGWERGTRLPDVGHIYKYYKLFSLKKNHFDDVACSFEVVVSRELDLKKLNSRGVKKLYDFYQKLLTNKKYLKNP